MIWTFLFLRRGSFYGLPSQKFIHPSPPDITNINYICQHCLVHLGDLSRYRNQPDQADTFYRQAIQLSPGNGQAYNQIALLESVLPKAENKLAAVFYYVRSIALKYPFPAGATNLSKLFSRFESKDDRNESKSIGDSNSFISTFLRFHSLLHRASKLQAAAELSSQMTDSLTSLVAAEKLSGNQLIRFVAISLFQLDQHLSDKSDLENSPEEIAIVRILSDFLSGMLNAFLLPVYTVMQGENLLKYFALPATKLVLNYIQVRPKLLEEIGFLKRLQIWPGLSRMLNELIGLLDDKKAEFSDSIRDSYPLPEEFGLQAFLPLAESFQNLNFKMVYKVHVPENLLYLRALRFVEIGKNLASLEFSGRSVISMKSGSFEAVEQTTGLVGDLLAGLNLNDVDSEPDLQSDDDSNDEKEEQSGGILKKRELTPVSEPEKKPTGKRFSRQNVAMNAIMRRATTTTDPSSEAANTISKQVTFKTPSPAPSNETEDDHLSQHSSTSQDVIQINQSPLFRDGVQLNQFQDLNPQSSNLYPDFSIPPPMVTPKVQAGPRPIFDASFPFLDQFPSSGQRQPLTSAWTTQQQFSPQPGPLPRGPPTFLPPPQLPPGVPRAPSNQSGSLYGEYSLFSSHPTWSLGGQGGGLFGPLPGTSGEQSPLERLLQQQQKIDPNKRHF